MRICYLKHDATPRMDVMLANASNPARDYSRVFIPSVDWRSSTLPAMGCSARAVVQEKMRRRHFHPLHGQKQHGRQGKIKAAGMRDRLAEGAGQGAVIHRTFAMSRILVDRYTAQRCVMEMGLRHIRLEGESEQHQGGDQSPAGNNSFLRRGRSHRTHPFYGCTA